MPDVRKNYTDEDIRMYAKEVKTLAALLRALGLKPAGGNYYQIKNKLQQLNVDCSHWTGQAWSKNEQLKDWSQYSSNGSLKEILLRERGHACESCKLQEWMGNPIPLEIDHIDGNRTNNSKKNLRLLCCNCHALTPTWKGRNARKIYEILYAKCKNCQILIEYSLKNHRKEPSFCSCRCTRLFYNENPTPSILESRKNRQKISWPSAHELLDRVTKEGYSSVGRSLGVSDNAVRKHLKKLAHMEKLPDSESSKDSVERRPG